MRAQLRWRDVAVLTAALGIVCAATSAWAQYPGKPVRVIVPFAAGGTPDVVGRIISQQLALQTGQAFVVENRPGADGVLGAQTVADRRPTATPSWSPRVRSSSIRASTRSSRSTSSAISS